MMIHLATKEKRRIALIRMLCTILSLWSFGVRADVIITTVHAFQTPTAGSGPNALILGRDGNLYGTTAGGGTGGHGTIFKFTTNGVLTTLYSFNGANAGSSPSAPPVQGSDGNLYGTTSHGGAFNAGTLYRLTPDGVFTSFHSFYHGDTDHGIDGLYPDELIQGTDGNLYGMTPHGGWGDNGVTFKCSTSAVFTNVHYFIGTSQDALFPSGALVQGADGDYYGRASYGGTNIYGALFKITANGAVTMVYNFTGGNDGSRPTQLLLGSDGNFYGTTYSGGTNNYGTVFRLTPNGVCTGIYSFSNGNDGQDPRNLVQGADGNFYGTSDLGVTNRLLFRVSADGAFTGLQIFTGGNEGGFPNRLVQGPDGNLYGTTQTGGLAGKGTIFKITPDGTFVSLYSFPGSTNDGTSPRAALVQGADGYFYGSTYSGGASNYGTIFKIGADGAFTSLYSFTDSNSGTNPQTALVQGNDGWLYSTTPGGGTNNFGAIFKISTNGDFASLYSFTGGSDSLNPQAPLVKGNDGNFYGTTYGGMGAFSNTYGTVFKIGTNGEFATLHTFTDLTAANGKNPKAGLVLGRDGIFYGTTYSGGTGSGTVFSITADSIFTRLYSFTSTDGGNPIGLVQGLDGDLYGATYQKGSGGPTASAGVFKMTTNGSLTSLYGTFYGYNPSRLVQGVDGSFYGTIAGPGGYYYTGGIVKFTANGILTRIQTFQSNDGAALSELVQGSDGSFYCTSQTGGAGYGAVLRITIGPVFKAVTLTNSTLTLTWSTDVGSTYQLQYKSDLGSGDWSNLGNSVLATGDTLSATDAVANDPRRFYRVAVLPQ
jgi:uncharacterized repeat protein (TIGR03803 family)